MENEITEKLKEYTQKEPNIVLAFVFGSAAKGRETEESDVDIGVYLKDRKGEDKIWGEFSRIIGREIDLIVLNDAPATLVANVFKTGVPLAIKNKQLYWKLYFTATLESEDFSHFAEDYYRIYQRSRSFSPEDKARILERAQFLETELSEVEKFKDLSFREYQENKEKRREIERWAENIINASIDIAKIALASGKHEMPRTYEEALRTFGVIAGLSEEDSQKFASLARLRNMLAHEYLDILHGKIQHFANEFPLLYDTIRIFLHEYIDRNS